MHAAEISRCPVALAILAGLRPAGGCATIVRSQAPGDFQLPEPWSGHVDRAPILFLTANPSISHDGPHPRRDWPDQRIEAFYRDRFEGRTPGQIRDGKYVVRSDGTPRPTVQRTWAELLSRAAELMDSPRPGVDYAFSEVVRCKSKSKKIGVDKALPECVGRWLRPVLAFASAQVIVACGKAPLLAMTQVLGQRIAPGSATFTAALGRPMVILFVGAPGSNQLRALSAIFPADTLQRVREMIADRRP